ncbi:MAG: hypothetical protein ABI600_19895 [Luteolibacter sp.]
MWRFLFFFSALGIAVALVVRWWFGLRVLETEGQRQCRCDLSRWMPSPDDNAVIHRAEGSAAEFGKQLREKALAEWRERDPKASAVRESSKRFGQAVPPLSGIVAVLAVVVAKIPIFGALVVFIVAIAMAAVLGLLAIAPELQAIMVSAQKLRENKSFPRRDDEDAVIQCGMAHAWKESLPPLLQMLQK